MINRWGLLVVAACIGLVSPCLGQTGTGIVVNAHPSSAVIGDVNQDGIFDERDIVLAQEAAKGTTHLSAEAVSLADVAEPCNKQIDAADVELLRQALYQRRGGKTPNSECHGQGIGTDANAETADDAPTLDEMFVEVAKRVPGFGGAYIDSDGKLAIVLQDPSPRALAAAQDVFAGIFGKKRIPKAGVKAVKGDFDFLALNDAHVKARSLLNLPDVVMLDSDERSNRLSIGVSSAEGQSAVEKRVATLGIPSNIVMVRQVQPVVNLDFPLSLHQLRQTTRPLLAGLEIVGPDLFCTLSLVAERSGVPGLLTCSHCTEKRGEVDGTTYTQISNLIGHEIVDPPFFTGGQCPSGRKCRFSDSAFAALTPGVTALRGRIANVGFTLQPGEPFLGPFSFAVTATITPLAGDPVQKVGRTTGYSAGEVSQTCTDIQCGRMTI